MNAYLKGKKVGLVLSGGGVRGMAHIGILKALAEKGIDCQIVAGSSVGALIGALYAAGYDAKDMLEFFRQTPMFKYNFFTINKPGFFDTAKYYNIFKKYLPRDSFEVLSKKLYVTATDLQKGELRVFSEGNLINPLLASAALPPVFSPITIENTLYADGGIINNFPLEPVKDQVDFLIGSNVSVVDELKKGELKTSLQLAQRSTALMIYAINKDKLEQCDLLFQPMDLEHIGVFDRKGLEKSYNIGYAHALEVLNRKAAKLQTSS